jgi:hypothetical protein
MLYQLTWKILPGMRGLYCERFSAVAIPPEAGPDPAARGVAAVIVEFASEAERDAFLRHLEEHFGPQRFSNSAAAFEAVKAYVLEWIARRAP